jgi:repressor LexA
MKLTARQQQILDFIHERLARDGMPPTRAEIVRHFGFRSPNAAQCHLKALAERGAIELRPGTARGIVPSTRAGAGTSELRIPIIGRVTAGTPILALENREQEMSVDPTMFQPRPDYILRVQGDSMIGAGIHDGDLLLVHKTPEARSGQIVVARIGEEVTVKRLRRQGPSMVLEPENEAYPIMRINPGEDFAIEGLGVGVIRPNLRKKPA